LFLKFIENKIIITETAHILKMGIAVIEYQKLLRCCKWRTHSFGGI